jgi:hypothetical protein
MAVVFASCSGIMQNGHDLTSTQSNRSEYFTVKDAANYLGISHFTLYRLLHEPDGPPFLKIETQKKLRPLIRIPKKKFFNWIKSNEG